MFEFNGLNLRNLLNFILSIDRRKSFVKEG